MFIENQVHALYWFLLMDEDVVMICDNALILKYIENLHNIYQYIII